MLISFIDKKEIKINFSFNLTETKSSLIRTYAKIFNFSQLSIFNFNKLLYTYNKVSPLILILHQKSITDVQQLLKFIIFVTIEKSSKDIT